MVEQAFSVSLPAGVAIPDDSTGDNAKADVDVFA